MKKSVLSILTFCFVFVGVLAFSCPVFAASHSFKSTTVTSSFKMTLDGHYNVLVFTDSAGNSQTLGLETQNAVSFSYPVSFQLPIYSLNGNANLNAENDLMLFRSSITVSGSSSATNSGLLQVSVGNVRVVIGSESFPVSNKSLARVLADVSSFRKSGVALSDSVFVTADIFGTFNSQSSISTATVNLSCRFGNGSDDPSSYGNPYFEFFDSPNVTTSDLQKQTDDLTNGYDNSSMSSDNSRLNDKISQYDQLEEETSNKSTAYIDGAEFVNPFGNSTVLASVTFATSFLQSLFMNLDIWQLVVIVSLCLVLALMLVGWFKFRGD